MKNLLLFALLLVGGQYAAAQYITIDELRQDGGAYIEFFYQNKNRICLKTYKSKDRIIGNDFDILLENNKPVAASSMLEALDVLHKLGYEVVLNYSGSEGATRRFLLKKSQPGL